LAGRLSHSCRLEANLAGRLSHSCRLEANFPTVHFAHNFIDRRAT